MHNPILEEQKPNFQCELASICNHKVFSNVALVNKSSKNIKTNKIMTLVDMVVAATKTLDGDHDLQSPSPQPKIFSSILYQTA